MAIDSRIEVYDGNRSYAKVEERGRDALDRGRASGQGELLDVFVLGRPQAQGSAAGS